MQRTRKPSFFVGVGLQAVRPDGGWAGRTVAHVYAKNLIPGPHPVPALMPPPTTPTCCCRS
jgi:hypothetical protein